MKLQLTVALVKDHDTSVRRFGNSGSKMQTPMEH